MVFECAFIVFDPAHHSGGNAYLMGYPFGCASLRFAQSSYLSPVTHECTSLRRIEGHMMNVFNMNDKTSFRRSQALILRFE